jgi:hypothetical protein
VCLQFNGCHGCEANLTHLHPALRLRISGATYLVHLYAFTTCTGTAVPLPSTCPKQAKSNMNTLHFPMHSVSSSPTGKKYGPSVCTCWHCSHHVRSTFS